MPDEEWITTKEAAEIIRVTRNQIRYLIYTSVLQAEKRGRDWFVTKSSAEVYAASDRKPGPKPRN